MIRFLAQHRRHEDLVIAVQRQPALGAKLARDLQEEEIGRFVGHQVVEFLVDVDGGGGDHCPAADAGGNFLAMTRSSAANTAVGASLR